MKLAKEEAVKTVQGLEVAEVHVLTESEYVDLLDNYKKNTIESELKSRIAKVYDDVDNDFVAATGLKKPDDQKTYKYWPSVVKQFKEKAEQAAIEAEALKKNASPDLTKELDSLRKAAQEKDADWKAKYDTLQNELTSKDIKNVLDGSTRGFKLANLPKPVLDTFIESAKTKLSASGKLVEGELVFMDKDGNPRINKETFKPYTAEEMMAIELEPIIDKGKDTSGGGTQPPKLQKDKDGKIDISMVVPTSVRTRLELTKFLVEAGLPLNTPEHATAYDKYSANLPGI
jgi:hypothetical protein